ncbi:MAG: DNA polymerase III subunit gamma/tau [Planctomycetaceae bacterium]|jgi:DNA polymerase-3 subunit gamma/tau|nr:DNA polymerase III subunit gamma/tau [Planctomycetaceae bacterium]
MATQKTKKNKLAGIGGLNIGLEDEDEIVNESQKQSENIVDQKTVKPENQTVIETTDQPADQTVNKNIVEKPDAKTLTKSETTLDGSANLKEPKISTKSDEVTVLKESASSSKLDEAVVLKEPESSAKLDEAVVLKEPESSAKLVKSEVLAESSNLGTGYSNVDRFNGSENYQVVARRYRPKTFDELVGQTHISQALANAISTGRIGHAYLFTGARGVGKTSTARIFSKSLNCMTGPSIQPCGKCDSCIGISTGEDIDVLEIDGASNRGIDEIRQLRLNASICPSRAKYKIYIIDEVHMLTREAFNALLKILEEPPEHVKFIFCTTEPTKIPITILSRCQRYDFAGIDNRQISHHLDEIAKNEGVTADDGVFDLIARRAAGSMRDAQSLLEQLLSFAPQHISLEDIHNMLGTANDQLLFRLLESIAGCDTANIFVEIDNAISEGVDLVVLVEQMMGMLRDLLVIVSGGNASLLIYCAPSQFDRAAKFANTFGIQRILAAIQILDQTYSKMKYNTQTRVLTELALVRIAYLDNFQLVSVLLDKLRTGEIQINLPAANANVLSNETVKSARRIVQPSQFSQQNSAANIQNQTNPPKQTVATITTIKPNFPNAILQQNNQKPNAAKINANQSNANQPNAAKSNADQSSAAQTQQQQSPPKKWSIELGAIDESKATEIWKSAVDSVEGMLGSSAAVFLKVQFEKPDVFIVTFQNLSTKEYCQRELPRLRAALCQTVGKNVQLKLLHEEIKQTNKKFQSQTRTSQENRAIFEAAANNPLVKKIAELFKTELIDAK